MTSYKLYYFNARGAVEPIRIIFALADVNYEDIRFEGEDWTHKFKPGTRTLRKRHTGWRLSLQLSNVCISVQSTARFQKNLLTLVIFCIYKAA